MVNKKHVFWQALLSAVLIFSTGILLGVWIESYRSSAIEEVFIESEISVLDSQLMGSVNEIFQVDCGVSRDEVFGLADRIYEEAKTLEMYDSSSQFTDTLSIVHRKYDLLRLMLWSQIVELDSRCGEDFNTVVYFYDYDDPEVSVSSKQVAFSRYLEDLKQKHGNDFVLIPIAGDLDLSSVDAIKSKYGVEQYPVVVVNEEHVIYDIEDLKDIEDLLFK